jgi:hypothetical protein
MLPNYQCSVGCTFGVVIFNSVIGVDCCCHMEKNFLLPNVDTGVLLKVEGFVYFT